jgi:hypothetical protein
MLACQRAANWTGGGLDWRSDLVCAAFEYRKSYGERQTGFFGRIEAKPGIWAKRKEGAGSSAGIQLYSPPTINAIYLTKSGHDVNY